jgi:putative ATP-dependent endonuclease of OLD family
MASTRREVAKRWKSYPSATLYNQPVAGSDSARTRGGYVHLSRVCIRNFRMFEHLEVRLQEGLNVIVGENNVGKTTVLDAIRAGLGAAASAGEPLRISPDDLHRRGDGTASDRPIRIGLYFAGLTQAEASASVEILDYEPAAKYQRASVHFEWAWNPKTRRFTTRRWGGRRSAGESQVPEDVMQSIPVTLLHALRDAGAHLVPGRSNRLISLLQELASDAGEQDALVKILHEANLQLEANPLVERAQSGIQSALTGASGDALSQRIAIRASNPEFDRVASALRLVFANRGAGGAQTVFSELRSNGLGYNNLLYIATVLAELGSRRDVLLPLLLVEEPEAHLHPQLQTLLMDFLTRRATGSEGQRPVQTIVTSHSPTLAAHVAPTSLRVLHRSVAGKPRRPRCVSVGEFGLSDSESGQLRRMLDVTRASVLFAQGVILVEGISEVLVIPALARLLGTPLENRAVSVVHVSGVSFDVLGKLFGRRKLRVPIAVVTDGDPELVYEAGQEGRPDCAQPTRDTDGRIVPGLRAQALGERLLAKGIEVFPSTVTLEYDLAAAGELNAGIILDAWARCASVPERLKASVSGSGTSEDKALALWRAVCLRKARPSKAELAQQLAAVLDEDRAAAAKFVVPAYIKQAIARVTCAS